MRCMRDVVDESSVKDVTQYWIDYCRECFVDGISVLLKEGASPRRIALMFNEVLVKVVDELAPDGQA